MNHASVVDHPSLNAFSSRCFQILQDGRGAMVITGVSPARYSEEAFERIYWGFGTHWGEAVVQSALGDRLGRARFVPIGPDDPTGRADRGNAELTLHADANEILADAICSGFG